MLSNDAYHFYHTFVNSLDTDADITSDGSRISPRGGREPSKGGGPEHTILPNSPKNCMKLKEFGCRGGGGVRPSRPPLDPPLFTVLFCIYFTLSLSSYVHVRLLLRKAGLQLTPNCPLIQHNGNFLKY